MTFVVHSRTHKTLRQSDPDFTFSPNGLTLVSRAGIEISQRCPENYKDLILECIHHGWLKPVAHMRDTEYTMELLRK
jgi:hypothetical protein